MKTQAGYCWAFIPARSGSKSVPMKNLAMLAGHPLLDYCVAAAKSSRHLDKIICSTDADVIADHCAKLGIEVNKRPSELATDETPLFDVIRGFLASAEANYGRVPEVIALVQPTSPFLLGCHLDKSIEAIFSNNNPASVQTVIRCPHNHHAYNQRIVEQGLVRFSYPDERRMAYNKQTKPLHYLFGNLVVFHTQQAMEQGTVFAHPSIGIEIPGLYGFDCDGPEDFDLGNAIINNRLVELHLNGPK